MMTSEWVRVSTCESIPLREGRVVEFNGHEIAVFNLGDRFLAMENRCPHRGGPLADGIVTGDKVVCPLHARKVCLNTGKIESPIEELSCVKTFPTRILNGHIDLQIPVRNGMPIPITVDTCAGEVA